MKKWWSKSSDSKAEHIAANRELNIRVRAHNLHMENAENAAEQAAQSMGSEASPNASEGINQDALSQLGGEVQKAKQFVHGKSKQLRGMRTRIRHSRRKAAARGKALGF